MVEYDLFNTTNLIQNLTYMYTFWYNFDTVLYLFLQTGTSDRSHIWYRLTPEVLRFQPIPPCIFPLQSLRFQPNLGLSFFHLKETVSEILSFKGTDRLLLYWVCSIEDKFFRIHIKLFKDLSILSLSANSTFKTPTLGVDTFLESVFLINTK